VLEEASSVLEEFDVNAHSRKAASVSSSGTGFTNSKPTVKEMVPKGVKKESETILKASQAVIRDMLGGKLPPESHFPDLKYRPRREVRTQMAGMFDALSTVDFMKTKNPCWEVDSGKAPGAACLPYAYVLGQPKCGTSDLFERLKRHHDIKMPRRKEVRWFTRGEFTAQALPMDAGRRAGGETRLGPLSSIYSFTSHFSDLASMIDKGNTQVGRAAYDLQNQFI
jgi:hypothetical protein